MGSLIVLALNSGSATLKFGLYRVDAAGAERLFGESVPTVDDADAMAAVSRALAASGMPPPDAVGHRIVHGGPLLRQHCLIDPGVLGQLQGAAAFAPLHAPTEMALIRSAQARFPGVPQAACLDTQFHASLPELARVLPLARELSFEEVHRYGFHGLSLESIVRQLAGSVPQRLVIAHLGNGASVTAVHAGRSIDTSMGLTPSGGVIMGTRSGDLDPGILLYLLRERKLDADKLEALIDQRSGLLGISGLSGDMRRLHAAEATNGGARLAIAMFCYSVRKQVAAMAAVLGGLDMLVFTGGIGERDASVRAEICAGLAWLGLGLDESRNQAASHRISSDASGCAVHVLPSQEEQQIAIHTFALMA